MTKAWASSWAYRSRVRGSFTRHGKPVAALVQPKDLDNLERLRKAGPEGGLSSVSGGWKDSEDLVRILEESKRYGRREEGQLE